jgi:hypothetical protein
VRLVPWAEIESIHVRRASRGTGIAVCGTLGLIAGLSIAFAEVDAGALIFGSQGLNGTPIVLGLAGGATLGWLIDHPGPWNTVYP